MNFEDSHFLLFFCKKWHLLQKVVKIYQNTSTCIILGSYSLKSNALRQCCGKIRIISYKILSKIQFSYLLLFRHEKTAISFILAHIRKIFYVYVDRLSQIDVKGWNIMFQGLARNPSSWYNGGPKCVIPSRYRRAVARNLQ